MPKTLQLGSVITCVGRKLKKVSSQVVRPYTRYVPDNVDYIGVVFTCELGFSRTTDVLSQSITVKTLKTPATFLT